MAPQAIANQITAQQHRLLKNAKASNREKLREHIRKEIEVKDRPTDLPSAPKAKMNVRRKPWVAFLDWFFARNIRPWRGTVLPIDRLVVGDDIVYRKNILDLLVNGTVPFSILLIYGLVLGYAWLAVPVLRGYLFLSPMVYLVSAIGLFLLVWVIYLYEDWRNDIFVLGKDKVIDIDQKPFGISTQRNEASFDKIQGINTKSVGPLNRIFNIGDVIIATGAAGNELVWQRVSKPELIQKEIFERMENLKKKKEEDQIADEHRRWAEWLGIYDQLSRLHERE